MTIDGRIFSFALLFNLISPFFIYADNLPLGVRGFAMGDRYAAVQKKEAELNELSPKASSDNSRLTYEGPILGEQAEIIYSFRGSRLCSVRYVWLLPIEKTPFLEDLKTLLARKYKLADSKTLNAAPKGEAQYWLYGGKEDYPTLLAELELLPADTPQDTDASKMLVLEFRAPDPDSVLIKRILKEDI